MMDIIALLQLGRQKGASDMHLVAGRPPLFRIHGILLPADELPVLSAADIDRALQQVTDASRK